MMYTEFVNRTGYEPTPAEWEAITREYMNCNDNKDTFCRRWCKAHPIQAGQVWREAAADSINTGAIKMLVFKYWNENNEPCKTTKTAFKGYQALKKSVATLLEYYANIEVYHNGLKVASVYNNTVNK